MVPSGGRVIAGAKAGTIRPAQRCQRHRMELRERVVVRQQHGDRLVANDLAPQTIQGRQSTPECHVEHTTGHHGLHGRRAGVKTGEKLAPRRDLAGSLQNQRRRQTFADDVDGEGCGSLPKFAQQGVLHVQQLPCRTKHPASGRREFDTSRGAVEQPGAKTVLEAVDVTAHGLLCLVEALRRTAEVQFLGDYDETPDQPKIEIVHQRTITALTTTPMSIGCASVLDGHRPVTASSKPCPQRNEAEMTASVRTRPLLSDTWLAEWS